MADAVHCLVLAEEGEDEAVVDEGELEDHDGVYVGEGWVCEEARDGAPRTDVFLLEHSKGELRGLVFFETWKVETTVFYE